MTHRFDRFKAHAGGLIRLNTELYWWGGRGWDDETDRICVLLDVLHMDQTSYDFDFDASTPGGDNNYYAHLLIDGIPRWVCLKLDNIELIDGDAE